MSGIQNLRKIAAQIKHELCEDFAVKMISYIEKEWMKNRNPAHWNMFQAKVRTNNRAEGYNNQFKAKVGAHPNPYTLVSHIVDEFCLRNMNH